MAAAATATCSDPSAICLPGGSWQGTWTVIGGPGPCEVTTFWGDGVVTFQAGITTGTPWDHQYTSFGIFTITEANQDPSACTLVEHTYVVQVPDPLLPQTITFTSTVPTNAEVGNTYMVSATGGPSGNPVTFSVQRAGKGGTANCTISGATVTFTQVGTCIIDANQAGNSVYAPAATAQQQVSVGAALLTQTITFTSTVPPGAVVGSAYTVSANGGASGNPVTFAVDPSSSSLCSITGSLVSFVAIGTCVIDANQAGTSTYLAAPQAQQEVNVGPAPQSIAFTSIAKSPFVGSTYVVSVVGGASGNPVTLTIDSSASSVCTISGATVTFNAVGTCVVDANQAGDANYLSAPQAQQPVLVTALPQAQGLSYGTAENVALAEAAGSLQAGVIDLNPTSTSWSAAEGLGPTHGSVIVNADGSFTYTPTTGFTGTDSFTYTLTDNLGITSAPATVTITVSASCDVSSWPAKITGLPKVRPGSPPTYYIGQVGGRFTVITAHKENNKEVTETGTITIGSETTGVGISNFADLKDEHVGANADSVTVVNPWTIQFTLHTFKSLDGFIFTASCGTSVTFKLSANGRPVKANKIHVGNPTTKAASNPVTESR